MKACHWKKWFSIFRGSLKKNSSAAEQLAAKCAGGSNWSDSLPPAHPLSQQLCMAATMILPICEEKELKQKGKTKCPRPTAVTENLFTQWGKSSMHEKCGQPPRVIKRSSFSNVTAEGWAQSRARRAHRPHRCPSFNSNSGKNPGAHPAPAEAAAPGEVTAAPTLTPPPWAAQAWLPCCLSPRQGWTGWDKTCITQCLPIPRCFNTMRSRKRSKQASREVVQRKHRLEKNSMEILGGRLTSRTPESIYTGVGSGAQQGGTQLGIKHHQPASFIIPGCVISSN